MVSCSTRGRYHLKFIRAVVKAVSVSLTGCNLGIIPNNNNNCYNYMFDFLFLVPSHAL